MRIKYIGPFDEVELDLPGGGVARVKRNGLLSLPAEIAYSLLEQRTNWTVWDRSTPPDPPANVRDLPASEIVRYSIPRLRRIRRLSQRNLVARLKANGGTWSQAKLHRVEAGERTLSLDDTLELAYALNTSPTALIDGTHLPSHDLLVAITPTHAAAARRLRGWLRGRDPLEPPPRSPLSERQQRAREYALTLGDRDWLERQQTTLMVVADACRHFEEAADILLDQLPESADTEEARTSLANAHQKLQQQFMDFHASLQPPSQRPIRPERRGKHRRREELRRRPDPPTQS